MTTFDPEGAEDDESASILGHSTTTTTTTTDQLQDANPGLVLNAKLFYFAKRHNLPPNALSARAIIDLITSNKPVPGIEQIPDTVLEPGSSKVDRTPRRRKPWEKGDEVVATATAAAATTSSDQTSSIVPPGDAEKEQTGKPGQTGDGLLRILQPNAIPPSGLLAHND
ncbi:hypothetical protein DV738_g2890, partial [Chaetothyriales sp. CBS 135597]